MSHVLKASLIFALAVSQLSCKTLSNRRDKLGKKSEIVEGDVYFVRAATRTEGQLKFNTKSPILCEVRFWPKDQPENESTKTCSNTTPSKTFDETIKPLRVDTLYSLKVFFWHAGQSRSNDNFFQINEGEDGDLSKVTKAIVARVNVPLHVSEFHLQNLPNGAIYSNLKQSLSRNIGCSGSYGPYPFNQAEPASGNLFGPITAEGFGSAESNPHPNFAERLIHEYGYFQANSAWQFKYTYLGKTTDLSARPAANLGKIIVKADGDTSLENQSLLRDPTNFNLSGNKPVTLEWITKNAATVSYLILEFKGKKSAKSLTCIFEGNGSNGEIPAATMGQLPNDIYEVSVMLESTQIIPPSNTSFPAWLITSIDWRQSQMTKI